MAIASKFSRLGDQPPHEALGAGHRDDRSTSLKHHKIVATRARILERAGFIWPLTSRRDMQCWIAEMPSLHGPAEGPEARTAYSYDLDSRGEKYILAGDLLVLCDSTRVVAVALAENVTKDERRQLILRCPLCNYSRLEVRKKKRLPYRCCHGHEFSTPVEEWASSSHLTVHYQYSYARVAARIDRAELRAFETTKSRHVKLKSAEPTALAGYLASRDHTLQTVLGIWFKSRPIDLVDGESYEETLEPHALIDDRDRPYRAIRVRRGLRSFRQKVMERHGNHCMISGCTVHALLEACHVGKYQGPEDNHAANGMLLRSDLHTLFDLDLIGIDPANFQVAIHPSLAQSEYERFAGMRLMLDGKKGIDIRAMRTRWEDFKQKVAGYGER